MLLSGNPRGPVIFRRRMLLRRIFLPLLLVEVLPVRPARHSVVIPEETPPPQFWHQELRDILERLREEDVSLQER